MNLPGRNLAPASQDVVTAAVYYALTSRRSVRGYLSDPVSAEVLNDILAAAARAPSGSNIQPWKVHALQGKALASLSLNLTQAFLGEEPEKPGYHYYPRNWREPYLGRRRATGWGLYNLAGIARGDREAGNTQRARNYSFFGAPVGLVFTIDDDLEQGSWLDYGMFLQSIMICARGYGLDSCPQAAIANYPAIIRAALGIPANETVVCGMALGYADPDEPTNALCTERQPLDGFVTFHD